MMFRRSGREATFESVPSTGYEIVETFPSVQRGVRHLMISVDAVDFHIHGIVLT
jgi:hypothetical protein